MMGMMPWTDPLWHLLGMVITASIVVGIYIFGRDRIQRELTDTPTEEPGTPEQAASQETGWVPRTGERLASYERDVPIWMRPTLADLDRDGDPEVLITYDDGRVVALSYDF